MLYIDNPVVRLCSRSNSILVLLFCLTCGVLADEPPQLVVQTGHTYKVTSVAFSPDGSTIATASDDDRILLWEVSSGKQLRTLAGNRAQVYSIAFSPDGEMLASAGNDGTIRRWKLATGQEIEPLHSASARFTCVAFNPDGRELVGADNQNIHIWDLKNNNQEEIISSKSSTINSIAFSRDGRSMATANRDMTVGLWDQRGHHLKKLLIGHSDIVHGVSFSPDGSTLASVSEDKTVRFWNADTGDVIAPPITSRSPIWSIAYSRSGAVLATGDSRGQVNLWSPVSHTSKAILVGHIQGIPCMQFSPQDEHLLATASYDRTVRLWNDMQPTKPLILKGFAEDVRTVQFGLSGKILVSGSNDGSVNLWNLETGQRQVLYSHTTAVHTVALSTDERMIASTDEQGIVHIGEMGSAKFDEYKHENDAGVHTATFNANSSVLVSGDTKGKIIFWDTKKKKKLPIAPACHSSINCLAFGTVQGIDILASGEDNGTVNLWDMQGRLVGTFSNFGSPVTSLTLHSANRCLAVGARNGWIRLLDLDLLSKTQIFTAGPSFEAHQSTVTTICFSPDGQTLASGGGDNVVKTWNPNTAALLRKFVGHTSWVRSLSFHPLAPFNPWLASASADGSIRLWNLVREAHPAFVTLVQLKPETTWAVADDDGRYDASNRGNVEGLHWVIHNTPIELDQFKKDYYDPGLLGKVLGYGTEPPRNVVALSNLDVNLPPTATLGRKNNGIVVTLTDQGGGIGPTDVFVNDQRIHVEPTPHGPAHTYSFFLPLTTSNVQDRLIPGEPNGLRVVGHTYDQKLRRESPDYLAGRGIDLELEAPKYTAEPPRIFLLTAGVSQYKGSRLNLRFAAKDAIDFSREVKAAAVGWVGAERVFTTLLASDAEHPELKPANRANLLAALDEIAGKARSTDIFLLYLSGHGVGAGSGEKDYYYVTADADDVTPGAGIFQRVTLSGKDIQERLLKIHAGKQAVILDTCASGEFGKREGGGDIRRSWEDMKDKTGSYVLAGCAADAVSYEASRYNQGLLTYCLLEAMKANDSVWVADPKSGGTFLDIQKWLSTAEAAVPKLVQAAQIEGVQKPEFRSAKDARDFWVGRLSKQQREMIRLAIPLPILLPTQNVRDEMSAAEEDTLDLHSKLNDLLLAKSARGRGPGYAFWNTNAQPGAYRCNIRYRVGSTVTATIYLQYFPVDSKARAKTVATFSVTAPSADLPEAIILEVVHQVAVLESKSANRLRP